MCTIEIFEKSTNVRVIGICENSDSEFFHVRSNGELKKYSKKEWVNVGEKNPSLKYKRFKLNYEL